MIMIARAWLQHWLAGVIFGLLFFGLFRILLVHTILDGFHQQGMRRSHRGQVEQALISFRRADQIWSRLAWLDTHRSWLLASRNRWSYRARARFNRVGCLLHLGRHDEARPLLQELLGWAPGMTQARTLQQQLEGQEPTGVWAELAQL
jgi:hypothetical protein